MLNLGLGLGSVLCRASAVTDAMVEASSLGLADSLNEDERDSELLYPRLNRIREISAYIAMRVIRKAQEEVRNGKFCIHKLNLTAGLFRALTETVICGPLVRHNS